MQSALPYIRTDAFIFPDFPFPLTVTKYFLTKGSAKGAMKRENVTLMCPGSFTIASPSFTRADMVKQMYKQFGIHNEYVVGVRVGPPIKVWFTGMEYVPIPPFFCLLLTQPL